MSKLCPICDNLSVSFMKVVVDSRYAYLTCDHCKGAWLNPVPSYLELAKIYEKPKYLSALSAPVKNPILQFLITRRITSTYAEWVKRKFVIGKILDVGCGNGDFLFDLQKLRWDVTGIDVSSVAVKNSGSKVGKYNIQRGDFLRSRFVKSFSVISFWHVLEHIDNPKKYFERSKILLNNNGWVVGEVPNFDSVWLKLFGQYYNWLIIPEHLLYFSKYSIKLILKNAGFDNIEIQSPSRGLLNFSLSLNNIFLSKKTPTIIRKLIFIISIPVSIISGLILSIIGNGEVLRFKASKA